MPLSGNASGLGETFLRRSIFNPPLPAHPPESKRHIPHLSACENGRGLIIESSSRF